MPAAFVTGALRVLSARSCDCRDEFRQIRLRMCAICFEYVLFIYALKTSLIVTLNIPLMTGFHNLVYQQTTYIVNYNDWTENHSVLATYEIFCVYQFVLDFKIIMYIPASILRKSTSGRHRPVSYPDGPITARYGFT